jgi:hypothetical protein
MNTDFDSEYKPISEGKGKGEVSIHNPNVNININELKVPKELINPIKDARVFSEE